jgi:hypothetical protein
MHRKGLVFGLKLVIHHVAEPASIDRLATFAADEEVVGTVPPDQEVRTSRH